MNEKFTINFMLIMILSLLQFIFTSYREYYIADEYIYFGPNVEIFEISIKNQTFSRDELDGKYIMTEFYIENRSELDNKTHLYGWNTTSYLGEFDSN